MVPFAGRRWPELRPHITKVWVMTLRAVDDIKETVRRQALSLARSIRGISLRLVDPQQTSVKDCVEAVAQILPLLLGEHGLGSSVTEVR
jgi:proteasome component ECM29